MLPHLGHEAMQLPAGGPQIPSNASIPRRRRRCIRCSSPGHWAGAGAPESPVLAARALLQRMQQPGSYLRFGECNMLSSGHDMNLNMVCNGSRCSHAFWWSNEKKCGPCSRHVALHTTIHAPLNIRLYPLLRGLSHRISAKISKPTVYPTLHLNCGAQTEFLNQKAAFRRRTLSILMSRLPFTI